MKNKSLFGKGINAFYPILIYIIISTAIGLVWNNFVVTAVKNDWAFGGINFGAFTSTDQIDNFKVAASQYVTLFRNLIFIVIFGIMMKKDYNGKKQGTFDGKLCIMGCFACVSFSIALSNFFNLVGLTEISTGYQDFMASTETLSFGISVIAIGIVAPIAEELLFRGLMYRRFSKDGGIIPAMILSSACFGVIHGNLVQIAFAFLSGLVLCIIYEKAGNIFVPIICHMAVNLVSLVSNARNSFAWMNMNAFTAIGSTILFASITASIMTSIIKGMKK